MKPRRRVRRDYYPLSTAEPPPSGQQIVKTLAATPWIEAGISMVLGLIFLFFQKRELAEITWVIGAALGFTRYAFIKTLEEKMEPLQRLASVIDLQRQMSVGQFQEMLRIYLEILEPEFRQVKDTIVADAIDRLEKLAQQKTSNELPTGDYYNWLLPIIRSTQPGSRIWAISMMMGAEWDESPPEETFLELNLDAARRGVLVERIFVAPRELIPKLSHYRAIKAQMDNAGRFMKPLVVEREYLESRDPQLLQQLGDGLMAFDTRVAMIDIESPEGIRGYVTMNQGEIVRLRQRFDNLRVHARDLNEVIKRLQREQTRDSDEL